MAEPRLYKTADNLFWEKVLSAVLLLGLARVASGNAEGNVNFRRFPKKAAIPKAEIGLLRNVAQRQKRFGFPIVMILYAVGGFLRFDINSGIKKEPYNGSYGSSKENRTPDFALRGQRLNRLTMEPCWLGN